MSEITTNGIGAESKPLPGEGTLANDSGVVGVCRIPGLRLKSFSLKLTERQQEVPPFEELDVGADPRLPPKRQQEHFEFTKQNHRESWERQRTAAENSMHCGFDLRYLLVLESDLTNEDLEKLRNALLPLSQPGNQVKGLCHKFYDEDSAVIPFFVTPMACHIVGGRDAITGGHGDAFRVVVIYETLLLKDLPPYHPAVKIKDVFTGENYAGEHPLTKAKKFVISVY